MCLTSQLFGRSKRKHIRKENCWITFCNRSLGALAVLSRSFKFFISEEYIFVVISLNFNSYLFLVLLYNHVSKRYLKKSILYRNRKIFQYCDVTFHLRSIAIAVIFTKECNCSQECDSGSTLCWGCQIFMNISMSKEKILKEHE